MRTEYLEAYMVKVTSLLQSRQEKEVKINDMSKTNKACFLKPTAEKISTTSTSEPILSNLCKSSEVRRNNPERVMSSRYVYTAKPL